jgi:integrase
MERRASKTVSVSWSPAQGQYRKYVGYQLGRNGKPQPKCWYLGGGEREAVRRAVELVAEWNRLKAAGTTVWPRLAAGGPTTDENKDDFVDLSVLRVCDACDLFLDDLRKLAEARQRSWSLVHSTEHRLTWVRTAFGPFTPISAIGEKEIRKAVLFLVRRPRAKRRNHQKSAPGPLGVKTVVNCIRQMKALLNWVHETDGSEWNKPKRFDKLFRIRVESMQTAEERAREAREVVSGDVATFTIEELSALWEAATDKVRLFILLGLNCGFTSSEVSDLRTFEVFLDTEPPHIHRRRNKTGIEAKWVLWPETVQLLRLRQAQPNDELRWLLTERGNSLVEVNARTRRDSIEKHWAKLLVVAQLDRRFGFRFLRKTGADAIKRLATLEESEMYLAHAEPGINKAYANRNWGRMWECLRQLRLQLPFLGDVFSLARKEIKPVAPTKRSKAGFRNVSYHAGKDRFYARVMIDGEVRCSGYLRTAEEAAAAAANLRRSLDHSAGQHGQAT